MTVRRAPGGGFVLHPEPHISYEPLLWRRSPEWNIPPLATLAAGALAAIVAALIAGGRAGRGFAALAAAPAALLAAAAYAAVLVSYAADRRHLTALSDRNDGWLVALYLLGWLAVLASLGSAIAGARLWRPAGAWGRSLIIGALLVSALGVAELWNWNLLSFGMAY